MDFLPARHTTRVSTFSRSRGRLSHIQTLICSRCGTDLPEILFRKRDPLNPQLRVHYVCKPCEQTERDRIKWRNRFRWKARRTLRTHAEKYVRLGKAASNADFAERFGWDLDQMAHDIEHSATNGCPHCRQSFAEMGDLGQVTLDIHDPTALPYYGSNTRWICKTCNTAKGDMPPEAFAEYIAGWRKWEKAQVDPWIARLFDVKDYAAA